jgi:Zn-dependent peptidase ImmA (M78 family)/DNA-binding XRE family transcriptional regulator
MLELARESRGLLQSELAERIGAHQSQISKIEQGIKSVDQDLLDKISFSLNYPPKFFLQSNSVFTPGIGFDRNRKSLDSRKRKSIDAIANIYRINLQKLLSAVELDVADIPRIDSFDNGFKPNDAELVASAVRQYYQLPKGPIDNLTKLIEDAGIFVIETDFGTTKQDGFTLDTPDTPPIIFVNNVLPPDRYRFTLAHEFGHIILHKFPTPDSELEANTFASNFLFPDEEAIDELDIFKFKSLNLKILQRLKYKYGISLQTIVSKGMKLNFFDENDRKYFYVQLSRAGYKSTNEPDCGLQKEKPTLLKNLIHLYRDELNYSIDELSEILYLNSDDLLNKFPFEQNTPKLRLINKDI